MAFGLVCTIALCIGFAALACVVFAMCAWEAVYGTPRQRVRARYLKARKIARAGARRHAARIAREGAL